MTRALYAPHENRFRRVASFGRVVPVPLAAKGTEVALGPLVAGRIAAVADPAHAVEGCRPHQPRVPVPDDAAPRPVPRRRHRVAARTRSSSSRSGTSRSQRQEYIPLARFVSYVPVSSALQVVADAPPLDLLRTALYAEDLDALDRIIAEVPEDRLEDVLVAAADADELDDALTLLELISVPSRVRVVQHRPGLDRRARLADPGGRTPTTPGTLCSAGARQSSRRTGAPVDVPAIRDPASGNASPESWPTGTAGRRVTTRWPAATATPIR